MLIQAEAVQRIAQTGTAGRVLTPIRISSAASSSTRPLAPNDSPHRATIAASTNQEDIALADDIAEITAQRGGGDRRNGNPAEHDRQRAPPVRREEPTARSCHDRSFPCRKPERHPFTADGEVQALRYMNMVGG
ncbi:hypothetical protein [Litchfieldella rifensis]|uniref:Uncharacterized protein n=1 Tax=Litchfieldella rifensis TaxID=762643 RepID=A0ABV7LQJ4_9GAMM